MEKRRHKRIITRLNAEIVLDDKKRPGFIENISEEGVYMVTTPAETPIIELAPDSPLTLKLQSPSGETLNLRGRVVWSYKTPPHGITDSIGIEIIEPSEEYKALLRDLAASSS